MAKNDEPPGPPGGGDVAEAMGGTAPAPPEGDPARVDDADADSAVAFWERLAPAEFKGLMMAGPSGPPSGRRSSPGR